MSKLFKFLFSALLVLIYGCETVVNIDLPSRENLLVVNSLFNPDSTWDVALSLSKNVLSQYNSPTTIINDASIDIIDDESGAVVDQLVFHSKTIKYRGSTKPLSNKKYRIQVTAPNRGTAQSMGMAPTAIAITKLSIDSTKIKPGSDFSQVPIKIHFKDPEGEGNYYKLQVNSSYNNGNFGSYVNYIYFESNDSYLQNNLDYYGSLLFNDKLFDGKEYIIPITIDSYHFQNSSMKSFNFILSTLSKEQYDYETSKGAQGYTSGDPFAQPVIVFSNIENGLGIFAGSSRSIINLLEK
jgi:hypothetical protein